MNSEIPNHTSTRSVTVRDDNVQLSLRVYDILGKELATLVNKKQKPGNYEVEFDGEELTSGIYIYELRAGEYIQSKKMLMLK